MGGTQNACQDCQGEQFEYDLATGIEEVTKLFYSAKLCIIEVVAKKTVSNLFRRKKCYSIFS